MLRWRPLDVAEDADMIDRRTFLHTTLAGTAGFAITEPIEALAQATSAASSDRDAVIAKIAGSHDATVTTTKTSRITPT